MTSRHDTWQCYHYYFARRLQCLFMHPARVLWICSLLACCTRHWWNPPYLFVDFSSPSFSLYQQTQIDHCLQRRLHSLANNTQKKATSFPKLQFSLLKMDVNKTLMNSDAALRFLRGIEDFHCQAWLLCYKNDSQLKEWENILKNSSTVLRKAGYPGTPGGKAANKVSEKGWDNIWVSQ